MGAGGAQRLRVATLHVLDQPEHATVLGRQADRYAPKKAVDRGPRVAGGHHHGGLRVRAQRAQRRADLVLAVEVRNEAKIVSRIILNKLASSRTGMVDSPFGIVVMTRLQRVLSVANNEVDCGDRRIECRQEGKK